jgi:hypothetical protein
MAFIDNEQECGAIAPTNTAGDFDGADYIDLGLAAAEAGNGEPLVMAFHVTAAITSYTDETYQFILTEDASGTSGSEVEIASSRVYVGNTLVAGDVIYVPVPQGEAALRYLGARITSVGTDPSGLSASPVLMPASMAQSSKKAHATNYSITDFA